MKLVQAGFLCLTLWALADEAFQPPLPSGYNGSFGGLSSILALLIPIIFLAAIPKLAPRCPNNYIPTPMDPNTCLRFFNDALATKSFADARTACQTDGGDLLRLNSVNFDKIRQLTDANKGGGGCSFWVGATEGTNGVWSALNGDTIPASPFFFPPVTSPVIPADDKDCGLLDNAQGFYLNGIDCTTAGALPQCYICQRNRII